MRYTLFSTPILSSVLRLISRLMLKIIRWRVIGALPEGQRKYVLIVAPHTSNWDFICCLFLRSLYCACNPVC